MLRFATIRLKWKSCSKLKLLKVMYAFSLFQVFVFTAIVVQPGTKYVYVHDISPLHLLTKTRKKLKRNINEKCYLNLCMFTWPSWYTLNGRTNRFYVANFHFLKCSIQADTREMEQNEK